MDVDGPAGEPGAEIVGEDLHIACEDDEICSLLLDQLCEPCLLAVLGRRSDGQVMEWNVVAGGELVEIAVVGDDRADVDPQRADAVAVEQVVEAMAEARHHDDGARALAQVVEFGGHVEALEDRRERLPDLGGRQAVRRGERRAQEEPPRFGIAELRAVGDVPALDGETAGDRRDNAGLVRAGEGEDEGRVAACHALAHRQWFAANTSSYPFIRIIHVTSTNRSPRSKAARICGIRGVKRRLNSALRVLPNRIQTT